MAAESSENRDMPILRDEIEELTTSIVLRHAILKNKLKDAIYNAYKLKINSSINEANIWEWYRVGNEEEKKAEDLIVGYQIQNEGLDKLHKLHNLDNKNIDKIKKQLNTIKYNIFVLDLHLNKMIKKYIPPTITEPDRFDERIVTPRRYRSRSRSRSPVRTKLQEPRHSSLKTNRNSNSNRNKNRNRNRNRTNRHIHFTTNSNIHQIEGLGSKNPFNSRVKMTHTSKEIGEMKHVATSQLIDRYISNIVDTNNEAFSKNTELTKQFKKNAILRYKTHMKEAQKIETKDMPHNNATTKIKADTLKQYAIKRLRSDAIALFKNDKIRYIKAKQEEQKKQRKDEHS
jgi:hypothetical protein